MKLYYPKSHYKKTHRGLVFPVLKPFIKGKDFTDAQRVEMYGLSKRDFEFTEVPGEADLVVLTMAWNYYVKTNKTDTAIAFVKECAAMGKKVLAWNSGDHGVAIPYHSNLIVLRESGYRSKFSSNEQSLPSFIADPLKKYYNTENPFLISYALKPLVGFCGQADSSKISAFKQLAQIASRNLKFYTGRSKEEPEALLSTIYLRAKILGDLENDNEVKTNFIYRERYRAGVTENKGNHQTTQEFYDNLKTSPYVVCVRGAGNFSVRFYEALAMGRIPLFINTDCSLPLETIIDWKKHVVWVDYEDIDRIGEKLVDFHRSLTSEQFEELQRSNRKLWEENLRYGSFFKKLFPLINEKS